MSLSENLQNLRKIKNMSQEELAEKLNVSRQAVSKWESGNGYPETEKIITICDIFDCSMDELVKGKISEDIKSEKNNYDLIMTKTSKGIAIGVTLILIGVSIMLTILGLAPNEQAENQYSLIGVIAILIGVVFAVPLFIINGTKVDDFKKKNPVIANVYSEDELDEGKSKYTKFIALGISIILIGVVVMMALLGFKVFENDTMPVAVLMYFVTIGASLIVYSGKMQDKFDIEKYNKENSEEYKQNDEKVSKICGIIMILATIIYLVWGFALKMWHINWIVFPVGGMLCGITAIILGKDGK
ncbi:MAG: helix-turn-helix domain-containing protein [Clostridia bacterium]|nr:helix-turn-helix domain-containing protein [Clostridia bacterium]